MEVALNSEMTGLDGYVAGNMHQDGLHNREGKMKADHERVAQMSLESLLFYVLVGEGRTVDEPALT